MATAADWSFQPQLLERCWRTWAVVESVLCETDWLRVYEFTPNWADGIRVGKLDNGGGDHLVALFTPAGTVLKGFDHESPVSPYARPDDQPWPGMYDGLPPALWEALNQPGFAPQDVTFCLWRSLTDAHWWRGLRLPPDVDDGSMYLLGRLSPSPDDYSEWARAYHGQPLDPEAVALLLDGAALSPELIGRLNPGRDANAVLKELAGRGLIPSEA
ncbi:hypothetical protein [Deinococcus sp.]|uniref:hypothetical protein n=1 Tax=Deinococcus sp. TaxID=47478 RepID=UPI003C7E17C8